MNARAEVALSSDRPFLDVCDTQGFRQNELTGLAQHTTRRQDPPW
jgi:hypothetical protein